MTRLTVRLLAILVYLGLNLAAAGTAAETNSPPGKAGAPETGPLAGMTVNLLHYEGVSPLEWKLARALDLIPPAESNRVILIPERDMDDAAGLHWIAVTRLKGHPQLILAHSEMTDKGVALLVYLTSSSGVLEQAVKRVNGGEFFAVPLADAAPGFQEQVAFWRARLANPDPQ